jgi:hypothetical protein
LLFQVGHGKKESCTTAGENTASGANGISLPLPYSIGSGSAAMTNNALAHLPQSHYQFTPTGLIIHSRVTFEQWQLLGEYLYMLTRAIQWAIGDWILYGEAQYGEMYAQALEETDYSLSTLQNITYVARAFESSRRRENLSFTHHAEVAGLPADVADHLLDECEEPIKDGKRPRSTGWLREQVRQMRGDDGSDGRWYECPFCHKKWKDKQ